MDTVAVMYSTYHQRAALALIYLAVGYGCCVAVVASTSNYLLCVCNMYMCTRVFCSVACFADVLCTSACIPTFLSAFCFCFTVTCYFITNHIILVTLI